MKRIVLGITMLLMLAGAYVCGIKDKGVTNAFAGEAEVQSEGKIEFSEYTDNETSKSTIYDKMLNSVENYVQVQGELEATNGQKDNVAITHFSTNVSTGEAFEETISDKYSCKVLSQNGIKTVYINGEKVSEELAVVISDSKERAGISTLPTGELTHQMRKDPTNLEAARLCLLPQEITFSFLTNFDAWEIVDSEKLLGRDCYVIKGELDAYMQSKLGATHFMMVVDKKTGIIMKYEAYGADDEIVDFARIVEISIE